jgi:hypothetical protein
MDYPSLDLENHFNKVYEGKDKDMTFFVGYKF